MSEDFQSDIDAIGRLAVVPAILDVVCRTTGMGFAAVARVTSDRWIACSVKDEIAFGLKPGSELKVESTICHEIRQSGEAVVIDHVDEDPVYARHHTPLKYGFQSYISMPIFLRDGSFFGTLCAIDPRPANLRNPQIIGMLAGSAVTWVSQGKHRKRARVEAKEAIRWQGEAGRHKARAEEIAGQLPSR